MSDSRIPPEKDVIVCRTYLESLITIQESINELHKDKVFDTNETSYSITPTAHNNVSISEIRAISTVEIDRKINHLKAILDKKENSVRKILENFSDRDILLKQIIEFKYLDRIPDIEIMQTVRTKDREMYKTLLQMSERLYTYYFFKGSHRPVKKW